MSFLARQRVNGSQRVVTVAVESLDAVNEDFERRRDAAAEHAVARVEVHTCNKQKSFKFWRKLK